MTINNLKSLTKSLSTLSLAALLSTSCGDISSSESDVKIFGGSLASDDAWLNTVAFTHRQMGVFCTGTALTPRLIVTAAHCTEMMANPDDVQVYIGKGKSGGLFLGSYRVAKVGVHPQYNPPLAIDHDVAYVTLTKDLDLPKAAYVSVPKTAGEVSELTKTGKSAHIVGFGLIETGDMGQKYHVDAPINRVGATEMGIGGGGKDSCQGDSGGPVFGQLANGQWRFIGVVSRGGACGTGGIYGLVTANICWVANDSKIDVGLPAGTCASK